MRDKANRAKQFFVIEGIKAGWPAPAIPRRMRVWISATHYICPYCRRAWMRPIRREDAAKGRAARHVYRCYERRLFAAGYVSLKSRIAPIADASEKMLWRLRRGQRRAK